MSEFGEPRAAAAAAAAEAAAAAAAAAEDELPPPRRGSVPYRAAIAADFLANVFV